MRVLIIGRGRLGTSLARALRDANVDVVHWAGRARWPTRTPDLDVVIVAVSDPFIARAAASLVPRLSKSTPVLHTSGARDREPLAALRPRPIGVMHPLVSFVGAKAALAGATAVVAGDPRAVAAARSIARALSLDVIEAALHGPRYHAAAALVANGAAALATRSVDALVLQGIRRRVAERAVAGLLRSVAANVDAVGVPAALTGPIVRGDAATVAAHRAAIDPRTRAAYDAIAPIILDVARDAGLPDDAARAIRAVLTRADSRRRRRAR